MCAPLHVQHIFASSFTNLRALKSLETSVATLEAEYELVARVQADSLALITNNELDKAEEKRFLGTF